MSQNKGDRAMKQKQMIICLMTLIIATTFLLSCLPEKISAKYWVNERQIILFGDTANFGLKDWDDPGADRVVLPSNPGERWKFVADIDMTVEININLWCSVYLDETQYIAMHLYVNGDGPSAIMLDKYSPTCITLYGYGIYLKGAITIKLNEGDFFDIRLLHTSTAVQLNKDYSYIEIIEDQQILSNLL